MRRKQKIGVVLPLANEEDCLIQLLDGIFNQLRTQDVVYCVIDRVSRDNTFELAKKYSDKNNQLNVVWAPGNKCVVDAYFRGYAEALEDGCDWILEMDGGMSHLPTQIPLFIEAMEEGCDFAAGSRFVERGVFSGSFFRYFLSKGGTFLTNLLLKTKMHDMTSGFECFTSEALSYVVEQGVKSKGTFFQTEIRVMLHSWNWQEIPITYKSMTERVPTSSIGESIAILMSLFKKIVKQGT